jgi:hypothetical protein
VKVFPNPAVENIFVELPENATKISILNITGQTVKQVTPGSESVVTIPVSGLAAGIYVLKVEKTSDTDISKFVVKK